MAETRALEYKDRHDTGRAWPLADIAGEAHQLSGASNAKRSGWRVGQRGDNLSHKYGLVEDVRCR